jgi:hypothetical protein
VVECQLPKLKVGGSNPLSRSSKIKDLAILVESFFVVLVVLYPSLFSFSEYCFKNSKIAAVLLEDEVRDEKLSLVNRCV